MSIYDPSSNPHTEPDEESLRLRVSPDVDDLEEGSFKWQVGENLNPKRYARLGQVWEKGKVWLASRLHDAPKDSNHVYEEKRAAYLSHDADKDLSHQNDAAHPVTRRTGLAKEEDLLDKGKAHLLPRLFGSSKNTSEK